MNAQASRAKMRERAQTKDVCNDCEGHDKLQTDKMWQKGKMTCTRKLFENSLRDVLIEDWEDKWVVRYVGMLAGLVVR